MSKKDSFIKKIFGKVGQRSLSQGAVLEETEKVIFSEVYYGSEESVYLKKALRENWQMITELVESTPDEGNIYELARFIRVAISLKYLIKHGLVNKIDDAIANLHTAQEIFDQQKTIISLEVMSEENCIKQHFFKSLTPTFKRMFASLDLRANAYEFDEYDLPVREMIELDFIDAYNIWDSGKMLEQDDMEEGPEAQGEVAETDAVVYQIKSYAIKVYSEDEDDNSIDFAIKLVIQNPFTKETVYVDVQGLDDEGFEVFGFVISGEVKANGETTLSDRFTYYPLDEFRSVTGWKFSI